MTVPITHIGGPTALIEVGERRLLTGPAITAADLDPIDAMLISHYHHGDNLDSAGRALLPAAGAVLTTTTGAGRLGGSARGLQP
jgi:L-ascorbate metabolism protein UlaG (beta-lactamase superfamily)